MILDRCKQVGDLLAQRQAGVRPALVMQNNIGNEYSPNTIVLAISSKQGNAKLDIPIRPSSQNTLKQASFVKCSQILTLSKARCLECWGSVDEKEMKQVEQALKMSLEL